MIFQAAHGELSHEKEKRSVDGVCLTHPGSVVEVASWMYRDGS